MIEENRKDSQGGELKHQLTPEAEKEMEAIAPLLSESLANDIRCFIGCLRPDLQDDEALSLAYMVEAFRLIPKEMSFVKTTMLGFYMRIKEQVIDNAVGKRG